VSSANSVSLVSMDSTEQHGTHVFDVRCRICTGSEDSTSSSAVHRNTHAGQPVSKDSDSSQQGVRSDQSPRKKICLAQRLKMYSTELQKNSSTSTEVQTGNERLSGTVVSNTDVNVTEMTAVCDVQQDSVVDRLLESYEAASLNKSKVKTDGTDWQLKMTVEKPQKGSSDEQKNADQQKLEGHSDTLHEERQKVDVNVTTSVHSGTARQQQDEETWKCPSRQQVDMKKTDISAAGYVAVSSIGLYCKILLSERN